MDPLGSVFHFFPRLPFELRREIYILATPPRIVHVRESWDIEDHDDFMEFLSDTGSDYEESKLAYAYDRFMERYQNEIVKAKLHPDLAYFARNWRHRIPFRSRGYTQMSLESYGFTSQNAPHQPWIPTDDTPEIPLRWLEEHLSVAFELMRESYLYSKAPIPTLLHTCTESRKVLTDYGYRIAFSTRTRGPRTWFHFGRDRLYLAGLFFRSIWPYDQAYCDLLSGSYWSIIGQFSPKDLQQVKRLVLSRASRFMTDEVGNFLPLLPSLEELFFEEWDKSCLDIWFRAIDKTDQSDSLKRNDDHGTKELWRCVPAEEIDAVAQIFCSNNGESPYCLNLPGDGFYYLNEYKEDGPNVVSYFDSLANQFETTLELQRSSRDVPWKLPRIKFVHTCSETIARRFVHGRLMFWHFYKELRKAYARDKPFIPLTVDSPLPPPPFQVDWSREMDKWDWHRFNSAQEMHAFQLYDTENGLPYGSANLPLRGWYLAKVNPVEPGLEII
ncbi:hypothetical protein F4776DRAFT_675486 [Hypoxylon sp. NC0597]|nr:hypothetical protein F4776DRAFT_675486 [Hypoxylon sp. NC0597]